MPFRLALRALCLAAAAFGLSAPAWSQSVQDVSFVNSQGVLLTGKLYRPSWSGARPAVVLMHGCAGIYSYSDPARGIARLYTEWANRLASAGYVALLVDSFGPRGTPQNQCGNGPVGVSEVSDRPHDANAARAFLASRTGEVDGQRIALLGWSHGGSSTFSALSNTMATAGGFRAGFAFYPGCGLYNAFGGISTSTYVPYAPLLILHGGADPLYQSGYCPTRIQRAIELGAGTASGNPIEMIVYSGAQHSFDNARKVDGEYTIYDVNAKSSADAEVMNRLPQLLR